MPTGSGLISTYIIPSFISGEPVSTETWLVKSPTDQRLLDLNITEYQLAANGDIRANKQYTLQTTSPLAVSTIGEFNPAQLIRNATYIKEHTSLIYNSRGDVAESYSKGRVSGMLYNDEGTAVIAKTEHTSSDQVAYSSFEEVQLGNWSLSGTPVYTADPSTPTGDRCLNMSGVTDTPLPLIIKFPGCQYLWNILSMQHLITKARNLLCYLFKW